MDIEHIHPEFQTFTPGVAYPILSGRAAGTIAKVASVLEVAAVPASYRSGVPA
jgi:hypothetical protein